MIKNLNLLKKRGASSIIVITLLLLVTGSAVLSYQIFFNSYITTELGKVKKTDNPVILSISGSELYIKNFHYLYLIYLSIIRYLFFY